MTFPDLVTALGIPVAVIAATLPWFLDRSALARLQRLDAIVSAAPSRGGANSLLREARDKAAIKVGMQILMPRFNLIRIVISVNLALAMFYTVAATLPGGRYLDFGTMASIAASVFASAALIVIRHFSMRRSARLLREAHGIPAEERPDASIRRRS